MRILTLCYEFPPLGGGGGRAAAGLARELARAGHEVDLVTMGFQGLPRQEREEGLTVHRVPGVRLRAYASSIPELLWHVLAARRVVRRLEREHSYDVNHTHFIVPDGLLAWQLSRASGLPYVITAHGSDVPGYNPDRFTLAHRLLPPLWNRVVSGAGAVVAPSETIAGLIRARRPDVTTVGIPYGMDVAKYSTRRQRGDRILVVTRMLERKGVQFLLHALAGWHTDCAVEIVGDGPYLPSLRELARELGVPVCFWGWLDNDSAQLRELYESSRIFVFTSEMENFPVVLLEAMTAGLAIITTRGTGCAEVVGDAALLVPPRDPDAIRAGLKDLVHDAAYCTELGQRARARIEREFGWAEMARRHLELYARHARGG